MVRQVISTCNCWGVASVETPGKGGRPRQHVTWEAEQAFLAPFFARAERGEIATAGEIKRAFEAHIGREINKSTISRLLKRHGWRKPVPRAVNPQASAETQEQFKKFATSVAAAVAIRPAGCAREIPAQSAFPSLDDLIEVLCQALTELTDDKERLHSMMFSPISELRVRSQLGFGGRLEFTRTS